MRTNQLIVLLLLIFGAVWLMAAGSYSSLAVGPIAPTLASCPKPLVGYMTLCPVGANTSFQTYVSYNGEAYHGTGW